MGFLDNSGDIILDAVLTDTGRKRLARGDGSFKVAKFALADDEINYGLYNKSHASGSAYFDLDILQTPVLEAFTNNASSLKSKLITVSRTNLLYLPIIQLHEGTDNNVNGTRHAISSHVVAVEATSISNLLNTAGVGNGVTPSDSEYGFVFDQGLDTTEITNTREIDADLYETQYIIELDNRLGHLTDSSGNTMEPSFIDDDSIASYYLTDSTNANAISEIGTGENTVSAISGPRGSRLAFKIKASLELNTSEFLFNQIGLSNNLNASLNASGTVYRAIDSTVKVQGATTGYSVEVPVRFVRAI